MHSLDFGWLIACNAALVLATALGNCLAAEPPERRFDEYRVKAAFLYNFARFIDWPADAFQKPDEPLSICVLGEDPFGRALDDEIAGKAIGGRFLAVRRISDARLTAGCHILFIGSSTGKRVLAVLAAAKQPGLLTVGDAGISISEALVIGFFMENGKVRFEINTAAADRAVLHISAKLLNLAQTERR